MHAPRQDLLQAIGLLILRLGFGAYLMTHGIGKLQMLLDGKDIGDPIGLGPGLSMVLITLAELVAPIFVILGLGTRFAALLPVGGMAVAAFVAHASDPWTAGEGARLLREGLAPRASSKEPALLFLTAFLALVFTGAGRISLDQAIRARRARRLAGD